MTKKGRERKKFGAAGRKKRIGGRRGEKECISTNAWELLGERIDA